jgi:hypothetical protein
MSLSKKRRRHAETAAFTSSGSLTPCSSFTARKRKEELAAGGAEEVGGVEGQETKGPVLIVCPSSVVRQWKSELLTWAHFEVDVCESGRTDCVLKAVQNAEIEVMVCSYDCYKRSSGVLNVMDWEVVIFDEVRSLSQPIFKLFYVPSVCSPNLFAGRNAVPSSQEPEKRTCNGGKRYEVQTPFWTHW